MRAFAYWVVSSWLVSAVLLAFTAGRAYTELVLPLGFLLGIPVARWWLKHANADALKKRVAVRFAEEQELERLRHGSKS